jgi:hypothetical protein
MTRQQQLSPCANSPSFPPLPPSLLPFLAVTKASEPWVCKLMNARREEYQRQKKEKRMKKSSSILKEISIRVRREGGRDG